MPRPVVVPQYRVPGAPAAMPMDVLQLFANPARLTPMVMRQMVAKQDVLPSPTESVPPAQLPMLVGAPQYPHVTPTSLTPMETQQTVAKRDVLLYPTVLVYFVRPLLPVGAPQSPHAMPTVLTPMKTRQTVAKRAALQPTASVPHAPPP